MPTSSGSHAQTLGLRSHGPVDEQPSVSAGPVQPIPSRVQQSSTTLSPTVPSGSSGPGPVPQPMTVLPVPALCGAPDATETNPPQGDSPALRSAPESYLEEVVGGWPKISSSAACRSRRLTSSPKIRSLRRPLSGRRSSTCVRGWQILSQLS
jgi:hypothetical protein